MLIIAYSLLH